MDPAFTLPNYESQPYVDGKMRTWGHFSYVKLKVLGEGERRICWRALLGNGRKVAIVKENFKHFEASEILHYTQVIGLLKAHPNIVDVQRWFWTMQRKGDGFKFFQIQTCYVNNLLEGINSDIFDVHPEWIKVALKQLAAGLAFIHSKGIIVNDLKLDNIFYRVHKGILFSYGDFGGADLPNKRSSQHTFTDNYIAPSRLEDKQNTQADDVFCLGICFASIQQPGVRRLQFPYTKWARAPYKDYAEHVEDYADSLDDTAWKPIICQMLAYLRSERPTAKELNQQI